MTQDQNQNNYATIKLNNILYNLGHSLPTIVSFVQKTRSPNGSAFFNPTESQIGDFERTRVGSCRGVRKIQFRVIFTKTFFLSLSLFFLLLLGF